MVLKSLLCVLLISVVSLAENIAVMDMCHDGISQTQARVIVFKLQSELLRYGQYKVIEREELENILREQGLQLTGLMEPSISVGKIAGISKAISGSIGKADDKFFMALKLVNVESGEILKSDYFSVSGTFDHLANSAGYALSRLFGETPRPEGVVPKKDQVQVHVHEEKVNHEVHVYQHAPGNHNKDMPPRKRYQPCPFCGGRGYTNDPKGMNGKLDCPYCSRHNTYQGPETGYKTLTGRWVTY